MADDGYVIDPKYWERLCTGPITYPLGLANKLHGRDVDLMVQFNRYEVRLGSKVLMSGRFSNSQLQPWGPAARLFLRGDVLVQIGHIEPPSRGESR